MTETQVVPPGVYLTRHRHVLPEQMLSGNILLVPSHLQIGLYLQATTLNVEQNRLQGFPESQLSHRWLQCAHSMLACVWLLTIIMMADTETTCVDVLTNR